jgi:hypothetical protein
MKSVKHHHTLVLLAGFLFLTIFTFGQSPYLGGQADGYASQKARIVAIAPDWARVYPSPVQRGEYIQLYASGDLNGLVVELFDAQGRLLASRQWIEWSSDHDMKIGTAELASGCYLVRVYDADKTFSQKVIVWGE